MDGLHIIANLKECNFNFLEETKLLNFSIESCQRNKLHVVGHTCYQFEPQGFTFTILLAESHLCIHTWPEHKSVALDIYTCNHSENNNLKTESIFNEIVALLNPAIIDKKFINRSDLTLVV